MTELKVLIVDDSPFMRKVFSDVIDIDSAFKVLATACDGEEAVKLTLELKPDIITMDLEMPRMNGIEALQNIMAMRPTPVIMLSAVTDNGTRDTIRALQFGAIDFIRKPDGAVKLDIRQVGEQLLEKLRIVAETIDKGPLRMLPAVVEKAAEEAPSSPSPAARAVRETKEAALAAAAAAESPPGEESAGNSSSSKEAPVKKPTIALPRIDKPQKLIRRETEIRKSDPPARPAFAGAPKPPKPQEPPEILRKPARATDGGTPLTVVKKEARPPLRQPNVAQTVAPNAPPPAAPPPPAEPKPTSSFTQIVAIGTSTGGPRALHEVLTGIPADFPAPILVVQHMPPKFTHSLAQRLDSFCSIHVREATDGEQIETATAYIAPGGKHMSLAKDASGKYRVKLSNEGPRSGHMPSVDVLFESLIGHRQLKRHAVLMTGMGSDGAKGMKALLDDGAQTTIAEAEQTCVVYGMPRSAVELGAATHQVPLQGIAPVLVQEMKSRKT
ncbi:two-component system chemotaxis response regulator CheB [Cohnella sp. SGD-V74]|uniref:protein-glutamate methylesterase/protein-glutamine glutaminase n=1 Tax=unclassified Cohnella TaxID=2636738 RepID=UPI000D497919|nr:MULTISPECIES: chemotaxis response regulator protein-glutamate methylesterase [unclassified Cohnella]PRX72483.1 two-component system chemotaxis response regulator CheB [Cohnella sp. SGD-V74]